MSRLDLPLSTIWRNQNGTTTSFSCICPCLSCPLVSVLVGFSWRHPWILKNWAATIFSDPFGGWHGWDVSSPVHWWIRVNPWGFWVGQNRVSLRTHGPCHAMCLHMADAKECIGCVHVQACSMQRNLSIACTVKQLRSYDCLGNMLDGCKDGISGVTCKDVIFELKPWIQVFSPPWKSHWRSKCWTCFKKA